MELYSGYLRTHSAANLGVDEQLDNLIKVTSNKQIMSHRSAYEFYHTLASLLSNHTLSLTQLDKAMVSLDQLMFFHSEQNTPLFKEISDLIVEQSIPHFQGMN